VATILQLLARSGADQAPAMLKLWSKEGLQG